MLEKAEFLGIVTETIFELRGSLKNLRNPVTSTAHNEYHLVGSVFHMKKRYSTEDHFNNHSVSNTQSKKDTIIEFFYFPFLAGPLEKNSTHSWL